MPKPLPALQQTEDYSLRRVQEYVRTAFRSLQQGVPFLDGILIGPITLTTTAQVVSHGLARVPRGVFALDCQAAGAVGAVLRGATDNNTVSLSLSAGSGPAIYFLWVW